jgi:hypothetical protein
VDSLPIDAHGVPEVVARELALVELPVTALLNGRQPGSGVGSSAVDASPSRERLVRIATMIRDAERAMPAPARRARRHGARLIPLAPRRNRSARSRQAETPVVDLAS